MSARPTVGFGTQRGPKNDRRPVFHHGRWSRSKAHASLAVAEKPLSARIYLVNRPFNFPTDPPRILEVVIICAFDTVNRPVAIQSRSVLVAHQCPVSAAHNFRP